MNFLGIDGGGSKTAFLLEDQSGKQIASLETGPSNWLSAGESAARQAIAEGLEQLPMVPDVVGAGFAGAGRPEGRRFYELVLASLLPRARIFVDTDAFVAYVGAIGLNPGVLLIAGTGSIAISRDAEGRMYRIGGWGSMFGDEGGGFWIGREAVRAALRANDLRANPAFVSLVATTLGQASIVDVVPAWTTGALNVRSIASLAPVVVAQYPEEPARSIIEAAASHLRELVEGAIRQSGLPEECAKAVIGSLGKEPLMRTLMGLHFRAPLHPPERGAIEWARARITGA